MQNLFVDGSVNSTGYVGGVAGENSGPVSNCHNIGEIKGTSVGGVVGHNFGGIVENCSNSGAISPNGSNSNLAGGVIGENDPKTSTSVPAEVRNCYSTGNVSGNLVGGVVGENKSGCIVENCYNTGGVTCTSQGGDTGGIVGRNNGNVTHCYNTGTLICGKQSYVGGVAGDSGGSVQDCCFLNTTGGPQYGIGYDSNSVSGSDAGAAPVDTLAELCGKFADVEGWKIDSVLGRPVLADNLEIGSSLNPYEIASPDDLKAFRDRVNNGQTTISAVLTENVDLQGSESDQWTPIGNNSEKSYTGIFDGNGHLIKGLHIENDSRAGFFDFIGGGGVVKNLSVDGTINGNGSIGGIVCANDRGTVENCAFTGSIGGNGNTVGGVVGTNSGNVINCLSNASISSNNSGDISLGGVVGTNSRTVENCMVIGEVNGDSAGGVVGDSINTGTVKNCYYLMRDGESTGSDSGSIGKSADAFHSGEVAWLLQNGQEEQVWGQNLTDEDSWPVLNSGADLKVNKVAFMVDDSEYHVDYANYGGTITLPADPSKDDFDFAGWDPEVATTITGDATYTAKWEEIGTEPDPEPDPDNPSTDPDDPGEDDPSDNPSTPSGPSIPSGPDTYPPTVEDSDHGSVEIDNDDPEAGDTVTITPKPDEGYEVEDVIVTDEDGNRVEVTENPDGSWSYEQPDSDVTIEVIFGEIEPEPTTDVGEIFVDVAPNAWYKDAVQYAYDNGLMTGVSANEFAPEQTTTRAMIVSIFARLENVTSAESAGFADVSDEWFATAVNWAASVGVVNGFEDNTFRPNDPITREQPAAILMNYSAWKGEDVSARADLTIYIDQPSAWAEETMQWAVAERLISGVTNDELQPQGNATRAQVAAILQRYLTK